MTPEALSTTTQRMAGMEMRATLVLHATRAVPRSMEIVLRKNGAMYARVGPPGKNTKPNDLMWGWGSADLERCRLTLRKEYASLWLDHTAFDVTLKEAEEIRRVFGQLGLKVFVDPA